MINLDPVRLEVLRSGLVAAAEDMSVAIWRTSRSTSVREILDYSTAVFDAAGRNLAQSSRIPSHLNSMATCLEHIIAHRLPVEDWRPGDVVMTNDPYAGGGQHLPDILTFKPVFVDGRRVAITGTLCHHIDMGGGAPSSYHPAATEIFQEGIRIPPIKVVRGGAPNREVLDIIRLNVREPDLVLGDLTAQIAALDIGARAIERLARKFGPDTLLGASDMILDHSERCMRRAIAAMPDGAFEFEDFVDDDGLGGGPIRIHVRLTISGDRLRVDLSGSSPQVEGPVNCTLAMSQSAVYYAVIAAAGEEIPPNSGCYRPVEVVAPPGLVVSALPPAPVVNRMLVGHRIVNAVMGALAQALPERIPAAYYGVSYVYSVEPVNEDRSRQVYFEIEVGGWGGAPSGDGPSAFSAGFHNLANSPVEIIEAAYPITFICYGLRSDSGGAGKYRGGLGLVREWRFDAPRGRFNASCDRFVFAPYGLAGGEPGARGRLSLVRDGRASALPSKVHDLALRRGDVVRLETSGGGGHGDPRARDPAAVAGDLAEGYVTPAGALAPADDA